MDGQETGTDWVLLRDVAEVMEVRGWGYDGSFVAFRGQLRMPSDRAFAIIKERASAYGLIPFLQSEEAGVVIKFVPARREARPGRPLVHVLLFLATVVTTLLVGAMFEDVGPRELLDRPARLLQGLPFSFTLLSILGCHELGHYFVSKKHGVKASLPYFIPFPNIFGTMGAVIVSRSPFPDRKGLFDVGIAGPLISFILSVIAIGIGLKGLSLAPAPLGREVLYFGDSILTRALFHLRFPQIPPHQDIMIGAVSFAGWVGLLVTAINLFPVGQLDGGHVAYAIFGKKHALIARMFIGLLVVLGVAFWEGWLIWVGLILVMGTRHVPPLDDITPLNPARKLLGWLAFLILALCFVPRPITG